jgi:protein-tyrosine phosphatase
MERWRNTTIAMNAIRPWLYIGKYRETLDIELLSRKKIGAMLQLAQAVQQPGITSLYLPVDDGVPLPEYLLRQGVDFVLSEKRRDQRVLIACGAGISRSAAFAVAALKEAEGLGLLEAAKTVRKHHPPTMLHPALWESLCSYYEEEVPFITVLSMLFAFE